MKRPSIYIYLALVLSLLFAFTGITQAEVAPYQRAEIVEEFTHTSAHGLEFIEGGFCASSDPRYEVYWRLADNYDVYVYYYDANDDLIDIVYLYSYQDDIYLEFYYETCPRHG